MIRSTVNAIYFTTGPHMYSIPAVFKLGSADQRGSATGSQGVRERIPKSSHCAFSALTNMKTRYRSRLVVEDDMRVCLSNITPRIDSLSSKRLCPCRPTRAVAYLEFQKGGGQPPLQNGHRKCVFRCVDGVRDTK